MIKVSADKAGDTLSELIALASESTEPIAIEREGQPVAATLGYSELKRFRALEDAMDGALIRRAIAPR
ncbi:MAG: type II toxin-antitoxin system prevent-host-death family antitoxin [Oscillatoria sp. SIO1A7]|nr:type II toxin-antitoxin system prevent-host-death family antitoxin [Oscillatoria sp. SIO1A7]